jgi:5-methylcytosine-specific restriction endonuclease McrA
MKRKLSTEEKQRKKELTAKRMAKIERLMSVYGKSINPIIKHYKISHVTYKMNVPNKMRIIMLAVTGVEEYISDKKVLDKFEKLQNKGVFSDISKLPKKPLCQIETWSLPTLRDAFTKKIVKPKLPESFYDTDAWIFLRRSVISLYGRECMRCHKTTQMANVDHIKPRSKHKEIQLDAANMQVLCYDCNMDKSNIHDTDYRKVMPDPIWIKKVNEEVATKSCIYKTMKQHKYSKKKNRG